jgi:hypothetical protein
LRGSIFKRLGRAQNYAPDMHDPLEMLDADEFRRMRLLLALAEIQRLHAAALERDIREAEKRSDLADSEPHSVRGGSVTSLTSREAAGRILF